MVVQSRYYQNLIKKIIDNSDASDWENAVIEWDIVDVEEDENQEESCICGKENLRYLFTIRNRFNNAILFPIGSQCIKKFERDDLTSVVDINEQLFKLLHAVENNSFLTLSSEYFSRKLLHYLYNEGAFTPNEFNDFESENDYRFMVDMFNKRSRTDKQNKKCTAIILNSIKPYLQSRLANKIRN